MMKTSIEHWCDDDQEKQSNAETRPSATLSTEYLRWDGPGFNPGFPRDRLATERLGHGTARHATADVTQNTQ